MLELFQEALDQPPVHPKHLDSSATYSMTHSASPLARIAEAMERRED